MTFPSGANLYTQGFGSRPENVEVPTYQTRVPSTSDTNWPIGKRWIVVGSGEYVLVGLTSIGGVLSANWSSGGNEMATTTTPGIVELSTLTELQTGTAPAGAVPTSNDVATVIAAVVVGAVPPATTTQQGIVELATDAQVVTPFTTDVPNTAVQPSNITAMFAAPEPIGVTTPNSGAFTDISATAVGTGNILTSDTASSLGVTGAGIDLTLSSAAGRVVVNGEEAAADAVRILSAAGGLDTNVALQMNLDSSQAAATAVRIIASNAAGGLDVDSGTGGMTLDSTGAISIDAAAASNFTVTGAFDNTFSSTAGSINISGGEAAADAINIDASAGGLDVDVALQMNLDSSQAANNAVRIISSAVTGGIDIDAGSGGITIDSTGAFSIDGAAASNVTTTGAGIDLTLASVLGSVLVSSTEDAALAIYLHADGGVSETIRLHADQGTGVASINIGSDVGGVTISGGLGNADAVNITASTAGGGIDIDSSTGGFDVLTTGAISLDASLASNLTVTGAAVDLTVSSAGGSVVITGTEAAVDAIQLNATTAGGGVDVNAGTGGITVDSGGLMSLDAAGVVNLTTTGAFDITVNSTAGSVIVTGAEAAVDAIQLNATTALGGIDVNAGTGGMTIDSAGLLSIDSNGATNLTATGAFDILINSTAGSLNFTAGEVAPDSMVFTNNGMDIVISGAATRDFDLTNTGGSVNITATESIIDAVNLTASGAAGGLNLTAGTNGILLSSGVKIKVTSVVTGIDPTPYALLGTDYFLSVDTGAGVMTITLPASPATGRTVVIYDGGGAAAGSNITIDGNGKNIAAGGTSAATKIINTAYESYTLYYNGTLWLGQNIV